MIQSTLPTACAESERGEVRNRLHVGIIMDGNGRWAQRRGLPRVAGHRAGTTAVRRVVTVAPRHGIGTLTLYAFSSDNWRRPELEVSHLMRLFRIHLRSESRRLVEQGVQVNVIGRRDRLSPRLLHDIESIEDQTRNGRTLRLQIAVDYSARDAIVEVANRGLTFGSDREAFRRHLSQVMNATESIPDLDLVVRTGGERRLSDFLLWESAYAELLFMPGLWPDFDEVQLASALAWFHQRNRRFGGLRRDTLATAREAQG